MQLVIADDSNKVTSTPEFRVNTFTALYIPRGGHDQSQHKYNISFPLKKNIIKRIIPLNFSFTEETSNLFTVSSTV